MATQNVRVRYNDKVTLTDGGQGTIKYIGEVVGKEGIFYGIDLVKGKGKNNGTFKGQIYFKTRGSKKSGKFVKITMFKKVTQTEYSTEFTVNDVVFIKSKNVNGIIKFVGIPSFTKVPKPMYGIQLNKPKGVCDGTFKKAKYFSCPAKYGIYVVQNKVTTCKPPNDPINNKPNKKKQTNKKKKLIVTVENDDEIKKQEPIPNTRKKRKRKIRKQRFSSSSSNDKLLLSPNVSGGPNPNKITDKLSQKTSRRLSQRASRRLSRLCINATNSQSLQLSRDAYVQNIEYLTSPSNLSANYSLTHSPTNFSDEESLGSNDESEPEFGMDAALIDEKLAQHGYDNIFILESTFQYELLSAELIQDLQDQKSANDVTQYVIIKKIVNTLNNDHSESESEDEHEHEHEHEEIDLIKEALLLEHLTIDNQCSNNYIGGVFMDFFESEKFVYLATEDCRQNNIHLHEFVGKAFQYIDNDKLKLKEYHKIIKYLLWQICTVLYWLHEDMGCCHLDIQPKNVYLENAQFIIDNEFVSINPSISVKLTGFGRSELFKDNVFICEKAPSLDFIEYVSPQVYEGRRYQANKADIWALGIMCYYCYVGHPLFVAFDEDDSEKQEYWSPQMNTLKEYVIKQNLKKYINTKVVEFLDGVLQSNENERFGIKDIVQHQWLATYYKKYKQQITQKSKTQKLRLKKQKNKLSTFPYYELLDDTDEDEVE